MQFKKNIKETIYLILILMIEEIMKEIASEEIYKVL